MNEIVVPIEVQLVLRANKHLDTRELLIILQRIVDDWYWEHVPTIPCGIINK
jgi:hypothetical protein